MRAGREAAEASGPRRADASLAGMAMEGMTEINDRTKWS